MHNPFIALRRATTTEADGEVIGFSLVYSGNFIAEAEVDPFDTTRVRIGISPNTFSWTLEPGAAFTTPEAIVVHSTTGLGGMSDALHGLYRERLARGTWRDAPRPVLINNWEATYFGFDEAKLLGIASSARDLGVELFVLDDGWFGERDSDDSSLGDWVVDRRKLPDGLDGLGAKVEALGLRFGIWIEPEMVSQRSRLFEAHPDWAVGVPGRPRTESRQQLVLDLSRPEIVDHLFGVLSEVLASAPISYVKWDMNRTITEPFSPALPPDRQGEFFHRYVLGVYDLYARLTAAFPNILFESCASGGGRFDPGHARLRATGLDERRHRRDRAPADPVGDLAGIPAQLDGRPCRRRSRTTRPVAITPLATRAAVAFFGVFGYELDPTRLDRGGTRRGRRADRVLQGAPRAVPARAVRAPAQPVRGRRQPDRLVGRRRPMPSRAVVGYYLTLNRPVPAADRLRLRGLDPAAVYRVTGWPADDGDVLMQANAGLRGGDELMQVGLSLGADRSAAAWWGDFRAWLFVLEAV